MRYVHLIDITDSQTLKSLWTPPLSFSFMIFAQYLLFIRAIPQNLAQSHEYYLKPNV